MKISVCLATYNGEKFIKEQLDSIMVQLSEGDEVIVSDDSSTDKTLDIINLYKDKRIKILPNQKFHSPALNFENALKYAKGDYIFLSDQDDIWLSNKVKRMVSMLECFDLVVSDCKVVDENLTVIEKSFCMKRNSGVGFWKNFSRNSYLGCCMAFRKEILKYILPFPKRIAMHDIWIGLSVELQGNPIFLREPLMLYRRHGNNVSFGGARSEYSFCYKIKYRLYMLQMLLKRKYLHK